MIERYTLPEMGRLWGDEAKWKHWLAVELLALEALVQGGVVPKEAHQVIKSKAKINPKRILEIEAEVKLGRVPH